MGHSCVPWAGHLVSMNFCNGERQWQHPDCLSDSEPSFESICVHWGQLSSETSRSTDHCFIQARARPIRCGPHLMNGAKSQWRVCSSCVHRTDDTELDPPLTPKRSSSEGRETEEERVPRVAPIFCLFVWPNHVACGILGPPTRDRT